MGPRIILITFLARKSTRHSLHRSQISKDL